MKKFVVYEWWTADEGGFGVCLLDNVSSIINNGINKEVLGNFDTIEELVEILYNHNPTYYGSVGVCLKEDGVSLYEKCLQLEKVYNHG